MKNSIVLFLCICYYCGYAQQWSGPNTTTSTIYRSAAVKVGYGPLYLDWTFENNWGGNANNWAGYIGFNAFRANNDTKDHYYGDNIYTSKAVFEGSSSGFRWLYRTTPAGSSDGGGQHLLAELMRISPTGNVGIGTTSPAGKLDVNKAGGQIRLSGGTVAGGIWTSTTDILYLADWNTGTKGLNINMSNGNVGIGTNSPDYKLTVNGKIKAEEVQVVVDVPADYVFEKDYSLMPLVEVEKFVTKNKHLPGMPDAQSLITNGWLVGEMNNKLLEKVEELTLYLIEMNKELDQVKKENKELKRMIQRD